MLGRWLERAGGLLPTATRFRIERRLRGWLECQRLQSADYVVVSFGKSGRTWLRVLISRLYQQQYGLPEGALIEFDNFHARNAALPNVFFTHDNYLRDYTRHGGSKSAFAGKRAILLVRHPADITVSQYSQWKHRMREHKIALNDYPRRDSNPTLFQFTMGPSGLPKAIQWLNEWVVGLEAIDHKLVVRYEDLHANTLAVFGRAAEFMQANATPGQIAEAVEWARFDNMRQREAHAASDSARLKAVDLANPDSFKARRAKAGGYRDDFADAQLTAIEQLIGATLDPRLGYVATARHEEAAN